MIKKKLLLWPIKAGSCFLFRTGGTKNWKGNPYFLLLQKIRTVFIFEYIGRFYVRATINAYEYHKCASVCPLLCAQKHDASLVILLIFFLV